MGCHQSKINVGQESLAPAEAVSAGPMAGRWHVALTTYPMWLKGDKLHPTISYDALEQSDSRKMRDHLEYAVAGDDGRPRKHHMVSTQQPGAQQSQELDVTESVDTTDKRDKKCPQHFKSKKSEFYIVYANHVKGVAGIAYTKSLSAGDGIHILVRDPSPEAMPSNIEAIAEAKEALRKLDRFRPLVDRLRVPAGFSEGKSYRLDASPAVHAPVFRTEGESTRTDYRGPLSIAEQDEQQRLSRLPGAQPLGNHGIYVPGPSDADLNGKQHTRALPLEEQDRLQRESRQPGLHSMFAWTAQSASDTKPAHIVEDRVLQGRHRPWVQRSKDGDNLGTTGDSSLTREYTGERDGNDAQLEERQPQKYALDGDQLYGDRQPVGQAHHASALQHQPRRLRAADSV